MALPKKNRLSTKKDIDRVFRGGRTVKGSFLFIRLLNNQKGYPRFAFVIPAKHIPLAIDRNKTRRMFSEEIMTYPTLLEGSYDVIVTVYRKATRSELKKIVGELREVLSRI